MSTIQRQNEFGQNYPHIETPEEEAAREALENERHTKARAELDELQRRGAPVVLPPTWIPGRGHLTGAEHAAHIAEQREQAEQRKRIQAMTPEQFEAFKLAQAQGGSPVRGFIAMAPAAVDTRRLEEVIADGLIEIANTLRARRGGAR